MTHIGSTIASTKKRSPLETALVLRAWGESDRLVPFSLPKIAIGADPRCHLRLAGRGLDPLHCYIVRGQEHTIVRNWSAKTRLNGRPFEEAVLSAGDSLQIGNYEVEIRLDLPICPPQVAELSEPVSAGGALDCAEAASAAGHPPEPAVLFEERAAALARAELELATRQTELAAERLELVARQDALERQRLAFAAELAALEKARDSLAMETAANEHHLRTEIAADRSRAAASIDQRATKLAAREAELDQRAAEFAAREAAFGEREAELIQRAMELDWLETELSERSAQSRARETELLDQAAALAERQGELAERQAELARDRDDDAQRRAADQDLRVSIEAQQADLAAAQTVLQAERAVTENARTDLQAEQAAVHAACASLEADQAALLAAQAELTSDRAALSAQQQDFAAEQQDFAAQQQELTAQQQELTAQQQELQSQQQDLAAQQQTVSAQQQEIAVAHAALEAECTALTARQADLESNHSAYAERSSELQAQTAAVETQRADLVALQRTLAEERDALHADRNALQSRALEVENQQHDLQQQAQALEDLCTQLNDREHELRNREANLQASAQDQAASRTDHEIDAYPPSGANVAGSQLSDRAPSAPQPAADDRVNDQATGSSADLPQEDVFARLREMSLLKDDAAAPVSALEALRLAWNLPAAPVPALESADAGAPIDTALRDELESIGCAENSENCRDSATAKFAAAAEPAAVADPAVTSPAAPSAAAHEEESVEVYMARLLGRLRGQSGESAPRGAGAPIAAPIRRATEGVAERDHQAAVRKSIVDPEPAHDEKKEEWTLRPRSHAPEMTSNLRAMRELANMNTKAALDLHVQKRWSAAAIGKGSVALVGLISAVLLLVWSNSWHSIPFAAGLIAMVVATFWGLQSFILANHVRIVRKADLPAPTTPTAAPSEAHGPGSPVEAVEPSESIDLSAVAAESIAAVDGSVEPA